MAVRDKIAAAAMPYLHPGEQIQAVITGQSANPSWALLSYWVIVAKDPNRVIIVTNQRILLFKTSRARYTKFKQLLGVYDRRIRFGEPRGLMWMTPMLGTNLWIPRRFHKDVRSADAIAPMPFPPIPAAQAAPPAPAMSPTQPTPPHWTPPT